jgi:hypothetical protein
VIFMTTAPEIDALSVSEFSCPDACDDAAAESTARANTRFAFGRMVLAALSRPAPITEDELASAPR